ncbi:MerR family transcriptional regulator [Kibdelosporangium philippinense]|uniref:MerR family transcriptional regulator n=1 Tax=Kibdelosporangium philippinense TaxID=211113 RepID=A0ABS8ZU66_9PSEU|nr:MerR family transcriptional regulator [Kibdelosporangium philippinense]MCE7011243.1 MerR family transcriptional regulator [Kibdelosporangium philippinense]
MSELWTIEQLPDQVAELLADDYNGQSSGRVRELPDRRTIRWYTTIGLVDRPAATRGRTVLYGRRQLLQIVAVKKLQATGNTLAKIQELLLGVTDERLSELAGVAHVDMVQPQAEIETTPQFWKGHAHGRLVSPHDDAPDAAGNTARSGDTVTKTVHGVRLADSVTVLLDAADRAPDADDLAAIEAAAAPLLEVLGRLGLAPTTGGENA